MCRKSSGGRLHYVGCAHVSVSSSLKVRSSLQVRVDYLADSCGRRLFCETGYCPLALQAQRLHLLWLRLPRDGVSIWYKEAGFHNDVRSPGPVGTQERRQRPSSCFAVWPSDDACWHLLAPICTRVFLMVVSFLLDSLCSIMCQEDLRVIVSGVDTRIEK